MKKCASRKLIQVGVNVSGGHIFDAAISLVEARDAHGTAASARKFPVKSDHQLVQVQSGLLAHDFDRAIRCFSGFGAVSETIGDGGEKHRVRLKNNAIVTADGFSGNGLPMMAISQHSAVSRRLELPGRDANAFAKCGCRIRLRPRSCKLPPSLRPGWLAVDISSLNSQIRLFDSRSQIRGDELRVPSAPGARSP